MLRESGFSVRKGETLRALAERFVDGRLSATKFARMSDEEIQAALTEVPGIGPWTARGFMLVALDRPDVFVVGGPCAPAHDPAPVRVRPPADRRRADRALGPLASVPKPGRQLPVRVGVRRTAPDVIDRTTPDRLALTTRPESAATMASERDRSFRPRRPWFGYRFS